MIDFLHNEIEDALAPFRDHGLDTSVWIEGDETEVISLTVKVGSRYLVRDHQIWIGGLSCSDACLCVFRPLFEPASRLMRDVGVPQTAFPSLLASRSV